MGEAWKRELASAVRRPEDLRRRLRLGPEVEMPETDGFPLLVPESFLERMRPGDKTDALLAQVLPRSEELDKAEGYATDPLEEAGSQPVPGLLRKYRGRALLVVTGACPLHCRYCFRRHFPYEEARLGGARLDEALEHLATAEDVEEVILSGGDPLSLGDDRLSELVARVASLPHLKRLRIHTRWPIAIPGRVGDGLLEALSHRRLRTVTVVHANHAHEIDDAVEAALRRLAEIGPVFNQAVLLRGVNDDVDALCDLSLRLFEAGVVPYYLHQLDRVAGAGHFAVTDEDARRIHRRVTARLPGYLVPRLVREVTGEESKSALR